MSPQLKPCPFCGGVAGWCQSCDEEGCHYIVCDGCQFQVDTLKDYPRIETIAGLREVMAKAWNRRVTSV